MSVEAILTIIGGVALLIGIFGGGVKAKDIEIPLVQPWLRVVSASIGVVLIIAAVLLSRPELPPSAPPTQQLPSPTVPSNQAPSTASQAEVDAKEDWQDTGIRVEAGQFIALEYLSGTWSECAPYGCPYREPEGVLFDGKSEEFSLNWGDNAVSGCRHAALIARVSNNLPFCVGLKYVGQVAHSGSLQLRINDVTIDDNDGSVVVRIEVK